MTMVITPLFQLRVSEKNVRQTHNEKDLEEMKASLLHHGLQQNLVTIKAEKIGDADYAVIAGGRRLRALQALHDAGEEVPNIHNWQIPCRIVEADDATEISLVENVIRTAMHPADQFEAWSTMMDEGRSSSDIATRFGVTEQTVRQRMKLGKVSPVLMQAYRDNDATLEQLMAFTITDDHARQLDVWDQVKNSYNKHPNTIRHMLTEEAVSSGSKLAQYVGEEAYEAAGGHITRDLFAEGCFFDNSALLEMLALKKLQESVEAEKSCYRDVVITLDEERSQYEAFDMVERELIGIPQDLLEQWDEKTERHGQLENGTYSDDDVEEIDEDMLQAEYDRLTTEIDDMRDEVESYLGYPDCVKPGATLFVWLGQNGEMQSRAMLPRPATPAASHDGEYDTSNSNESYENNETTVSNGQECSSPTANDDISTEYSQSLKADLATYKGQMLQSAIGSDFSASFDLMTYSLAVKVLTDYAKHGYRSSPLDVALSPFNDRTAQEDAGFTLSGMERVKQHDSLSLDWLHSDDDAERFVTFCALSEDEKQAIFSYCTASAVICGTYKLDSAYNVIAQRLNIEPSKQWRPGETNFFKRVKKPQLLMLVSDLLGDAWVAKVADQTKGQMAAWLGKLFEGNPAATSGMNAQTLTGIEEWMPEGMEFDSIEIDSIGDQPNECSTMDDESKCDDAEDDDDLADLPDFLRKEDAA